RSKAEPNGDGSWAISGQKIYISWGDHDFGGNVCHLVLARTPDGKPGTKGISLFLVPKFLPDANGEPGQANSLKVISLEHKLGLHGSPTAVMEYDQATGWMVGPEFGGMAAMFTMMNNARLGVGVQGLSQAEAATQKAMAYALERRQGRVPVEGGTGTIADHADVRRMLMTMKALTSSVRAICLETAISLDLGRASEGEEAQAHAARGAFLTPIAKAFGTDIGCAVAEMGVQVHGGMGFIEETGAAQFYRDVRVTAIYEGTNGIQAMDLVARKLADGGVAARALLDEIEATARAEADPTLRDGLSAAAGALRVGLEHLLGAELNDRFGGAAPYLRAFGLTLGAHYLLKAAQVSDDANRRALAAFHIHHLLPEVPGLCAVTQSGSAHLYGMDLTALAS
ncbi:MAG: acyl-CoA dehydrogenase, partial [Pseudomonadota bacterium]